MDTNIVLVLVMGLPGSGKTTLCKALQSYAREDQGRQFIHLCYDDLIPLVKQREFVERRRRLEERYLQHGESKEKEEEAKVGKEDKERSSISEKDNDIKTIEEVKEEERKVKEDTGNEGEERKSVPIGKEYVDKVTDNEKKRRINDADTGGIDKIDEGKKERIDTSENGILEDWKNARHESKIEQGNWKVYDGRGSEGNGIMEDWKNARHTCKIEEGNEKINTESEENFILEDWKSTRHGSKNDEGNLKIYDGKSDEENCNQEDKSKNEDGSQKINTESEENYITEDWKNTKHEGKNGEGKQKINIENEENDISEDWKRARHNIHTQLDQLLHYLTNGTTDSDTNRLLSIPLPSLKTGEQHVILLDDNFYYRSMRYEFHQLARKHSTAFCQLYLKCSVEDAIVHNNSRVDSVPVDVVTAMQVKLQPPQPDINTWEGNTCVVNSGDVSKAWDVIEKSFHRGLTPIEDRDAEIQEARKRCSLSVIHQADLTLRSIVKRLVKEELCRAGDTPKSTVAGNVNKARKAVLQELRQGVAVPCNLADAITEKNRLDFDVFLEGEMKMKMSL